MAHDRFSYTCKCGMRVRISGNHEAGVYHKRAVLVRKLLRENQANFTQIGVRLGISRERVRQIAKGMGIIGRPRALERALQKQAAKFEQSLRPPILSVIGKCAALGFSCDFVGGGGTYGMFVDRLRINGRLCLIRKISARPTGAHYLHMRIPTAPFDFVIYYSAFGFFIMPRHLIGGLKNTMFTLTPALHFSGNFSTCHDYPSYLEAWHLLGKKTP